MNITPEQLAALETHALTMIADPESPGLDRLAADMGVRIVDDRPDDEDGERWDFQS